MKSVLDLDCGNSRTKWRFEGNLGMVSRGCIPRLDQNPDRVRVSSVSISHEKLRSEIYRSYGVEPEFAMSTKTLAGVTNSYFNPSELGIDRWLAMVAAWNKVKTTTMVVDAGTALTIDILDDSGQHLGGYIVPGLESMRKSLAIDTANVQINSIDEASADCRFGNNTRQAVQHGLMSMVVSWINQTRLRAEETCGAIPTTFLAGGDRRILMKLLDYDCRSEEELVLDGLEIALP
ncbi:MAG: type III pantothenate kinase [Gammaproteobacteria bacterium]|nr:type III pantothenate kinase [Gammaproteobacteria bacterium]